MILNCTMCVKIKEICHLNTLYCEWPWGRFLSVVKALKPVKLQSKVRNLCLHSHFPKPSNGLDWKKLYPRSKDKNTDYCLQKV